MVNYEADTRYDREGDYIHSRCVEYDWCLKEFKSLFHNKNTEAEQIRILDVGSAKGDPVWIEELLNCGGCLTLLDYDEKPDEIECNYIKAAVCLSQFLWGVTDSFLQIRRECTHRNG